MTSAAGSGVPDERERAIAAAERQVRYVKAIRWTDVAGNWDVEFAADRCMALADAEVAAAVSGCRRDQQAAWDEGWLAANEQWSALIAWAIKSADRATAPPLDRNNPYAAGEVNPEAMDPDSTCYDPRCRITEHRQEMK